jgi:hypothetical protein
MEEIICITVDGYNILQVALDQVMKFNHYLNLKTSYQEVMEICCSFGLKLVAFETAAEFSCVTGLLQGILSFPAGFINC